MNGSKVSEELISTVRSIVGLEYFDMDIIRSLHFSKHDATAAINIIFDSPQNFKPREKHPEPEIRNPISTITPVSLKPNKIGKETKNSSFGSNANGNLVSSGSIIEVEENVRLENDWWLVGSSEVSGLSTSKGRKVQAGEEVYFTFPLKSSNSSPSGLVGKDFGRGRAAVAACSEIVRFSIKNSGEVQIRIELNS